jgi:hypothetical protein
MKGRNNLQPPKFSYIIITLSLAVADPPPLNLGNPDLPHPPDRISPDLALRRVQWLHLYQIQCWKKSGTPAGAKRETAVYILVSADLEGGQMPLELLPTPDSTEWKVR